MLLNFSAYHRIFNEIMIVIRKFHFEILLNIQLLTILYFYIQLSLPNIPFQVPLFLNFPWGKNQIADKNDLWIIFIVALFLLILNSFFSVRESLKANYPISRIYLFLSLFINSLLCFYTYSIIDSVAYKSLVLPDYIKIILIPTNLAFWATVLSAPFVIKIAKEFRFMDDPLSHKHPGMLLTKPVPRAGGLAYILGILIPGIFILPISTSQKILGILSSAIICVAIGLKDDRKDVSPYIRLFTQLGVAAITALSGITLIYISNPFGEAIKLDYLKYTFEFFGPHSIYYLAVGAAMIWIITTMNFMSWSNGTDGVFAGLVFISSLVISILMFDNLTVDPESIPFVKLAALSAGAGLGMAFFTWPPQKILWGFGATSAGLIIAALSIMGSTKVATTMLVLMIPFLDGIFAIIRRLSRGQLPFWGDREHFHHKLLEGWGWSKKQIALFYWTTGIILGTVGILTSKQLKILSLISVAIVVGILIAFANIRWSKKRNQ
jgi:UDP-GlcNAc:undecaprenyl-phosphate GlcNAc-1-phosphate transferase